MYQSWNETWVPPRTITTYYKSVVETMGGESKTKDFYRLFMVPDFGMCAAMFPGTFDALGAVQQWREEGIAPDQINANYSDRGLRLQKTARVPVSASGNLQRKRGYERCGKFQLRHSDLVKIRSNRDSDYQSSLKCPSLLPL